MKKYSAHPHIPQWIEAMDGELLTTPQLDILDFIHWCKKFGCRTSNDRIGSYTHHTHSTVQRAIAKLYRLDLVAIENYAKRTRNIKPVPWPDHEAWQKYQKLAARPMVNAALSAPHITILDKTHPLRGVSSIVDSEPPTTGDNILPGGCRPQPPAAVQGGVDKIYQLKALNHRDKMLKAGWSQAQANRLAKTKYPKAKFD